MTHGRSETSVQLLLYLICIAAITSCQDNEIIPFFPQQRHAAQTQSMLGGQLALVKNCLRIEPYLVIWPPEYSLVIDGKTIRIHDNITGHYVAQVGDTIVVGGNGVDHIGRDSISMSLFTAEFLPPDCPGPYWFSSNITR